MINKCFIFPGQGSQFEGMGKKLYQKFDYAKKIFNQANDILGYNIKNICFDENPSINKTKYTQPAIFIYNIICDYYLKDSGYSPTAYAGHSLGEYSALASSGCLSTEDCIKIIKIRSEEMYDIGITQNGKMLAVLSADYESINNIIDSSKNKVVIANYNSSKQTIISGQSNAIDDAVKKFKKYKIRTLKLNVSGAFHSPLMNKVKIKLDNIINNTTFNDTTLPIYQNVSGKGHYNNIKIKKNLLKQINSPVKWIQTINNMNNDGYIDFIEVGPGNVLTNLNKNINSNIICTNFNKLYPNYE